MSMPKYVVTVQLEGRQGRVTIDAPDAEAARLQAEMDGHNVRDVAMMVPGMPVEPNKAPVKPPATNPAGVMFQLLCALLGVPAFLCLVLASMGEFYMLPGGLLLFVLYFALCKPRQAVWVWSCFRGMGLIFVVLNLAMCFMVFYDSPNGLAVPTYKSVEEVYAAAGRGGAFLGYVLLAFSRIRVKP